MTTWSTGFCPGETYQVFERAEDRHVADRGRYPGPAIIEHPDDPHRAAADTPNELDQAVSELVRPDNGDVAREVSSLLPAADLSREKDAPATNPTSP